MAKQLIRDLSSIVAFKNQALSIEECEIMIHYAQANGKMVPPHTLKQLGELQAIVYDINLEIAAGNIDKVDPRSLNMALIGGLHNDLSKVIAPASPETVLLLERNKRKGLAGILGPIPLVRRLNVITILCLFAFLGLFFAEEVDSYTINGDILSYEGIKFVYNELVIVAIAALGASFYALFEVYKYITNNSYNPKYDSIYLIRFILGIVSGVILAQFIFISPEILGEGAGSTVDNINKSRELGGFMTYKPLLAFLGGFSARVVHKILHSMIDAIETFISGSARDMAESREQAAKVQMEDKLNAIKQKNAQTEATERMRSTMQLMQLKEELNAGANSSDISERLNQLMNEFMKPVAGVDVNFTKTKSTTTTTNPYAPIVEDYDPIIVEKFDDFNENNDFNNKGNDVDEIDIPDFPEDMDNPDFPMPGDIKEDFNPNDPNLKV